ncbi:RluA family pseudouridine synthase [Candidatus Peregrinibacteria bacterium]|nr:RluA family pseudouridine synthase [Candidatus Peregrinibacteria bacterium]
MSDKITISGNDSEQRLDRYLRKKFPELPLSVIYKYLRQKKVKIIRGEKKFHGKKEDMLQKGDEMHLYFDASQFGGTPKKDVPNFDFVVKSPFFKKNFRIQYEDEYLWIADKLPGIAVHPGTKTPSGKSLIDLFLAYQKSKNPNAIDPKLAHRLDKDTSGLIIIAKNDLVLRKLSALFRDGGVKKQYLALVQGKLPKKSGMIESNLLRTEGSKHTKIQVSSHIESKPSRTFYSVREYSPKLNASLVEVTLDTGRMHQIRVHFASEGHPLAGDDVYGERMWNRKMRDKFGLKRHFLHAYQIAFPHPITHKKIEISSPLPEDLSRILKNFF